MRTRGSISAKAERIIQRPKENTDEERDLVRDGRYRSRALGPWHLSLRPSGFRGVCWLVPKLPVRDDYRRDAGCWWLASALSLSAKLRQCLRADTTYASRIALRRPKAGRVGPFEWVRGPSGALRRLHAIRRRDCRSRQVCRLVGTSTRHSRDHPPGGADTREPTSRPCLQCPVRSRAHDPSCRVVRATEPRGCRTRPRVARCPAGILRNQRGPRLNRIARAVATRTGCDREVQLHPTATAAGTPELSAP
jgi:hypothetical protein